MNFDQRAQTCPSIFFCTHIIYKLFVTNSSFSSLNLRFSINYYASSLNARSSQSMTARLQRCALLAHFSRRGLGRVSAVSGALLSPRGAATAAPVARRWQTPKLGAQQKFSLSTSRRSLSTREVAPQEKSRTPGEKNSLSMRAVVVGTVGDQNPDGAKNSAKQESPRSKPLPPLHVEAAYPRPQLTKSHSVLVRVSHTALNRADLLQRQGLYPPPPGAPDVLGLECVGEVVETHALPSNIPSNPPNNRSSSPLDEEQPKIGARVMALLEGGGYAEYVACAPGSLLPADRGIFQHRPELAACVPEVWLTAYQLLSARVGRLGRGESVLVHAAGSAVGLAAVQLARKVFGAGKVVGLVRNSSAARAKQEAVICAGADRCFLRDEEFFGEGGVSEEDEELRRGFDVVLDPVVGGNFTAALGRCRRDARYVVYAAMGGAKVPDFNFGPVFRNSLSIVTSTLRARSLEYKAELVRDFARDVLPLLERGELRVNLDATFVGLGDVEAAHERMASNEGCGKIVVQVRE